MNQNLVTTRARRVSTDSPSLEWLVVTCRRGAEHVEMVNQQIWLVDLPAGNHALVWTLDGHTLGGPGVGAAYYDSKMDRAMDLLENADLIEENE